jgi:hypothetical protein
VQGRFTSPDPYLGSGKLGNPQSWNRYAYVWNNPLRLIDPNGLEVYDNGFNDPPDQIDEDPEEQQQQEINIKVAASPVEVFINRKMPDGSYFTGVGSVFTITLTDANGKPLAGANVTEQNVRIEGSGRIVERPSSLTTSAEGVMGDIVAKGRVTTTAEFGKSGETVEEFKDYLNQNEIKSTTEQTLTVKTADKQSYQIIWQRTVTNIGPDGKLNEKLNENGVNVTVTYTTPVIKRLP